MIAKPYLIKSTYISISVFNSEGYFCLFIEPHNAGFYTGVLSVGGTASQLGGAGFKILVGGGGGKHVVGFHVVVKCNS